jgi:hypothetical protein
MRWETVLFEKEGRGRVALERETQDLIVDRHDHAGGFATEIDRTRGGEAGSGGQRPSLKWNDDANTNENKF